MHATAGAQGGRSLHTRSEPGLQQVRDVQHCSGTAQQQRSRSKTAQRPDIAQRAKYTVAGAHPARGEQVEGKDLQRSRLPARGSAARPEKGGLNFMADRRGDKVGACKQPPVK